MLLGSIRGEHIYLSPFPLSLFATKLSAQLHPYLMELHSPARTIWLSLRWMAGNAFHFLYLDNQEFGFSFSEHRVFLLIPSRQNFYVFVPCCYCNHELLTADKLRKAWPTHAERDSHPIVRLLSAFEGSKIGTRRIDFLWIFLLGKGTISFNTLWGM